MKKNAILLIALIISMPISFAYEEKIYVYGSGLIASKESNNQNINYYHQDYLSSNRVTTNNNGEITGKNTQEPYGSGYEEKGNEEALANDYKFTGKEEDNSLYYFGARYYSPDNGRFISVDPVFNPGISPYAYANDNPMKYIDPTGAQTGAHSLHSPYYFGRYNAGYSEFQGSELSYSGVDIPGEAWSLERLDYVFGYNLDPETSWPMNFLVSFGGTNLFSSGRGNGAQGRSIFRRGPSVGKAFERSFSIGRGSFGEARQAENLIVKRARRSSTAEKALLDEYEILSRYGGKYEFLPRAYSFGKEGGRYYLIKDFVEGQELLTMRGMGASLAEVEVLAEELGRFTRETGISLVDLNLGNVVRTSGGRLMVIDFIPEGEGSRFETISDLPLLVRYVDREQFKNSEKRLAEAFYRGYNQ